ncbi:MAG: TonB-dependent receptor [Chitinophaga sp.]|uniref:SusC/RagA family TonB-linked outer membrane protein n=1 Tax=Chitinophaga sp. TaxID=1869181 RepID=UPI0025C3D130|nr:SusC/RagA family TonB-linked outer membrane protein [Chitinophaga sp.]MBV8252058.1 TonB-dependent receptor [Chitinophaga sp.]
MKLSAIIITVACLQVSAAGYSQHLTLSGKNLPLKKIFREINRQTGYEFLFQDELLDKAGRINIQAKDLPLEEVLKICLRDLPVHYTISDHSIVISSDETKREQATQQVPIKGTVTDENGKALQGATIKIKGTSKGTATDANGNFNIEVPNTASRLVISYIGYETVELPAANTGSMKITLQPAQTKMEDVVVVGYGRQKKIDLTGAVGTVNMKELSANASSNVTSALQGRVAGVTIESNSGAPGAGLSVTIRGSSTLGTNSPLVIVDGVPYAGLDGVNPNDIESINVLKDAASAAIYGSRGANGVIIVTTKGGKKNTAPTINLNINHSIQSVPKRMKMLSGDQWTKVFNANGGTLPAYNGINTNWQDEIFRTAPMTRANMEMSGGMEHFTYSLSGSYAAQQGTVINTQNNNANFRVKTQFEQGRIKIGETFIYGTGRGRTLPAGQDQAHSVIISSWILPRTIPVRDTANPYGGWGRRPSYLKNLSNPIADLNAINNATNSSSMVGNAFLEFRIFDQLKYKLNTGYNQTWGTGTNYTDVVDDGNLQVYQPQLGQSLNYFNSWIIEHTLSYDKKIGKHDLSLLAGMTAQRDSSSAFSASGTGLPLGLSVLSVATANQKVDGSAYTTKRQSLIGRVNYAYDSRYLFSASIRRDGSSKFADGYRWGIFPSVSAGWNISNEAFFQRSTLPAIMSALKIRGSYGLLGNDQISDYATINSIQTNLSLVTNNGTVIGSIPSGTASPRDLTWEKTQSTNIGVDASFLGNKLNLVFDWFNRTSKDILLQVPVPLSTGIGSNPFVNAGTVTNKGIELNLDYSDHVGTVRYRIGGNITAIKNRMTQITIGSGSQEFGDISRAKVGYPLGSFFLIKTAGIFKTQQEIDAYVGKDGKKIQPNAAPGDLKFVDYDNNGVIDNNDQQYCGSPFPSLEAGLTGNISWKHFDFNVLIQGTFGNKIYNGSRIWTEKMTEYINYSTDVLNAWSPTNTASSFPRFILSDPNQNARTNSDRWLESGSYVRIKRLELGYTIPTAIFKSNLKINSLRAYLSAENLFTFTKYKGYNPDLGNGGNPLDRGKDGGAYPLQRIISVGATVSF